MVVVKEDFLVILSSGRRRLLCTHDGEPSVIDSVKPILFLRRVGVVSKQSDGLLSLSTRLVEAAAVEEIVDRCPERVEWRPAYELGVPLRPLILRDPLLLAPPAPPPAGGLFLFLLGGMGLHWTAANNACNTFMSPLPLN